jgi:hypothetical protein
MSKCVAIALLLILSLSVAFPAFASVCRNYSGHQICIVSINRSAKNYWEYRAVVSVDAIKRPIEIYNCRTKAKVQKDGAIIPFADNDPGKLICSFFKN